MILFTGFLIEGEAAVWHKNLTKELTERYGARKKHEIIPPHVTLLQPLETENIDALDSLVSQWAKENNNLGKIMISDFGKFDEAVVFAKIEVDENLKNAVEDLKAKAKSIADMPKTDHPVWTPHATLASKQTKDEIGIIWNYVNSLPKPHFVIPFNNVCIFRLNDEKVWVVEKKYNISF